MSYEPVEYLDGFYGPENVSKTDSGDILVFIDEKTATGISIPDRFRRKLTETNWERPFIDHLQQVADGYDVVIHMKHHLHHDSFKRQIIPNGQHSNR